MDVGVVTGFGKTEVAIRAAFTVDKANYVCFVPTTILATNTRTFTERLKDAGFSIGYLNRFRTKTKANTKIIS
jgi:transcription-repair coupling factor (superfamily II helicase)